MTGDTKCGINCILRRTGHITLPLKTGAKPPARIERQRGPSRKEGETPNRANACGYDAGRLLKGFSLLLARIQSPGNTRNEANRRANTRSAVSEVPSASLRVTAIVEGPSRHHPDVDASAARERAFLARVPATDEASACFASILAKIALESVCQHFG